MPRTLSTIVLVTVAAVATLASPTVAQAAQPDMFDRHTDRAGVLTGCAGYDVTFAASIDARYIVTLGDTGQPLREIRHVTFTGALSGPGGELPYTGHFTRTSDFEAQRAVFTGLRVAVPVPGAARMLAAGADAFSLDLDDDFAKATGRLPDAFYADVCAALAP